MQTLCLVFAFHKGIHKLLLRLKKYVTDDLLNNLLFGAVEITEIPNKLFIMFFMPVQLSCPAFFDSYRLRTLNQNIYQTKTEQRIYFTKFSLSCFSARYEEVFDQYQNIQKRMNCSLDTL